QREVVLLRYFEDLPPRAIARRLGLPVETVKTRQKRALAQLRARLQPRWPAVLWFASRPLTKVAGAAGSWWGMLLTSMQNKVVAISAALLLAVAAGALATSLEWRTPAARSGTQASAAEVAPGAPPAATLGESAGTTRTAIATGPDGAASGTV